MQPKNFVQEKNKFSQQTLKYTDVLSAIQTLHNLVSSSRGPHGNIKVLQNQSGGHLTLTSSSKRLLNSLSITKPVIQLLVSSAQGHVDVYSDCGLFLISFATSLAKSSLESGLNCKILSEMYEKLLTLCVEYLNSDECGCKMNVVMSDIKFMKNCVRTVIQSKPLCRLNKDNLDLIPRLIIEAFLCSISDSESVIGTENVHIMCHDNGNVKDCKLVSGLMLQAPELSKYKTLNLDIKKYGARRSRIKVAMVTVSMSGDMEEMPDAKLEVLDGVKLDNALVERQMNFCQQIIEDGIGILLCQKVVHPKLKLELRESGVLVVDRLGLNMVGVVCKISGSSPIRSLLTAVQENSFGWLDKVDHVIESGRSYLLLTREASTVSTLILCHQEEESLEELKEVCTTALHSLFMLLYSPVVLFGGGCWQSILAQYLRFKVANEKESLASELECSQSTLMKSCELFTHALQMAALPGNHRNQYSISETDGHVYQTESNGICLETDTKLNGFTMCCCKFALNKDSTDSIKNMRFEKLEYTGSCRVPSVEDVTEALKSRDLLLDNFTVCINALKTAVLTACTVLRIGQVIQNV